jgi:hypothetical protein
LTAAAQEHQQALREARRLHTDSMRQAEADGQLRDRRVFAEEKNAAQAEYHGALVKATDDAEVHAAAAAWLRRLDQMNRRAREADERADTLGQRVGELGRTLPSLELAADAARISAEAAQVACLEARRILAACDEETARRVPARASGMPGSGPDVAPAILGETARPVDAESPAAAARALMRGDRQTLLGLALRLAEETGFEAGRMQLLLLELREQITTRALDEYAFAFPPNHPFWSQFHVDIARGVAASLSAMGYRFDGVGGWADGRSPQIRDLALALSYSGYDPRTLRRPAGQAAIDALWQGTRLRTEEYLLARAPQLTLQQIVDLLGPPGGRLGELWDMWGRLRPLLMRSN